MDPVDFKPKGILKKPHEAPDKEAHLRWDEDNLRITEAQKDAKMKVLEPKTPYIHYNPELDADLQEMEDLKLCSDASSRSSSVASSPKHAVVAPPPDWVSESEDEAEDEEAKARHERFQQLRKRHYHLEGKYVHQNAEDLPDSDVSIASAGDADSSEDEHGRQANGRANGHADVHVTKGFISTYGADDEQAGGSNMEL
ncbi:hypothetical protein EC988_003517 [Linderina pennispora]|nr:hypothetical protein EC988_003517 [Linderina pennispora]